MSQENFDFWLKILESFIAAIGIIIFVEKSRKKKGKK